MTLGIGVDLAEISETYKAAQGRGFLKQVYSPRERELLAPSSSHFDDARSPWNYEGLARSFTLKESFLKALGTGWALGIRFEEIEAYPAADAGTLHLWGRAAEVAKERGVESIRCGTSLQGDVVVGWVWLEGRISSG